MVSRSVATPLAPPPPPPTRPPLVAVSDDLTGAAACAAELARAGRAVSIRPWPAPAGEVADAVVLDAATRLASPEEAYSRVRALVADWRPDPSRTYYHRVDSGLRGNVRAELEAVCEGLGRPVVVAPAAPSFGVTTIGGIQRAGDVETAIAARVPTPADRLELADVRGSGLRVLLEEAAGAGTSTICDAETLGDLHRIAAAATSVDATLVGSYGLGGAFARGVAGRRDAAGVLALVSSLRGPSRAQVALAQTCGVAVLAADDTPAADPLLRDGRDVVLATSLPGTETPAGDPAVAARLADAAVALARAAMPSALILVGGELASAFVRSARAQKLDVLCEPWPATPLVRLRGGELDGAVAAVKSGARGGETWLLHALDTAFGIARRAR